MRGMTGMRGIKVGMMGMQKIRVGIKGIGVEMWGIAGENEENQGDNHCIGVEMIILIYIFISITLYQ